uniref:Nuclear pore complex protein Nup214 phenylalanine-glycine (FG) domain-containing protein n=1 Tax=Heliothis virescens TaxID=7102 RepID=A0A2A4JHJ1_HELVI
MDVLFGPNSVDEPTLLYKLQRKIKVFNTNDPLPNRGYNLVACASKYGIVFVASPDGNLTVYYLQQLIDKETEPQHMTIKLQEKPTHIAASCDHEMLAVTGGQLLTIFKITDFQNPNVSPALNIRCDVNPSTFVSALQWNPCIPDTIAIAFYDGTLLVSQVSTSQVKKVPSKARCLCWSPKGKQLVTGNSDGTLSQYKPDLTPAKTIAAPNLIEGAPVEALAVYWISTFQFAAVYKNATDNSRPAVTIINTPKAGPASCQNYEDICYSMGSNRPWYYYLLGLAQWNIIMASSSNGMEIASLGSADGANWVQWCQPDEARPELPLTDKKQENYPVGLCIDTCAAHQIQWDENTTLPHMPLLHVVSQSGLLTIFNVINLNKQAAQVCSPPQQIVLPAAVMTTSIPGEAPPQAAPAPTSAPAPALVPVAQPKPQVIQPVQPSPAPQPQAPPPQYNILNQPKPPRVQSQTPLFSAAPQIEQKPAPVDIKPPPMAQLQASVPQPQPAPPKLTPAQIQENAALKAEQEKISEMKANQELKNMLVKEVNDFQMELYKFMVKTRETQAKLQRDIDSINASFNYNSQDAEQLRKECSSDELRNAIAQLKLELVRACAVVAEARTHAEAKDSHQWTQADPLTTKRVASVKKLAYYVQNQLEQAQKSLDYKWSEAPQPQPAPPKLTPAQIQENAALKAEQEKISEMKANQELKNMLVKEVNDFQMELYKFMVKTRETQAKLQRDIDSINASFNYNSQDAEQLRKECSSDELRNAIAQLKLELVRACAVVAEARTHAEAKDSHQWTQADPLTTKRVASVKKLAYYVQNQLEQAQKSLDYKWSEAVLRDSQSNKSGPHMIRPVLDDVYQPLVKQQEILSRQQAVLRTLRNTLNECDVTPMFKSTSLLRNTPFRNKDPLSKLTKNILNMSLDTNDGKKKESLLTAQKLDVLRDMLSNHKTVKIKPVNVEMRQHLATMRMNYEKSLKEKVQPVKQVVKTEPDVVEAKPVIKQVQPQPFVAPKVEPKVEPKPEPFKPSPINVPSFTPVGGIKPTVPGLANVARTLFTEEPKPEPPKQPQAAPLKPVAPAFSFSSTPASADTRSVLKDLLQNKQAKNDANTFMGQPICSPSSFAFTTTAATSTPAPSTLFTGKPVGDNMFSKFQPQTFVQDSKPQAFAPEPKTQAFTSEPKLPAFSAEPKPFTSENKLSTSIFSSPKSSETGEPEAETKTVSIKPKTDKPLTNLFALKTSTPMPSPIVPDVLKTTKDVKTDAPKPAEKEKSKENVPQKVEPKVIPKPASENKEASKPLPLQTANKTSIFGTAPQPVSEITASVPSESQKPIEQKPEPKAEPVKVPEKSEEKISTSTVSSIFGTANVAASAENKPQASTPTTEQTTADPAKESESTTTSKPSLFSSTTTASPSAASVFGAAVTSQAKPASPAGSIFSAGAQPSPTPSSVFGTSSQGSIFGNTSPTATTTASVFGSSAQSVFSSAASTAKPSVFSTPAPATPETPPSPQSVFGSTTAPTTTQAGSIFGSTFGQTPAFGAATTSAPSSPTSVFGASTTSPVFGATPTTQASVFGATTTTTPSVFGTVTPATTQSSIFGSATPTPSAFTSATTPSSGAQSIFASAATTKPSVFSGAGSSVFGSAPPNTGPSVFGAPSTQASVFGATTATTQSSVFGSPTPTSQASVFGSAPTTQASVFGSQPTATTQASIFGGGEANMFAAASISTTSAPTQSSGGSIFGGGSSSPGSVFGSGNTNVFGGKAAFGQSNSSAAAIFGGGGATTFGQQKPATNFWSGGSANTEGGFGSTGFGQTATTQASSIFGNTTGGSFSTPSPTGQAFGSPQAPAFGGGDKPSVFGSPQQSAPAFGGSASFGAKPLFGQPSGFGSPPSGGGFGSSFGGFNKSPGGGFGAPAAFGGGATFGGAAFGSTSPGKMFGAAQPTGFGQPTQSNATFESLATQNTLTFGNLAQQAQAPQPQAPSFNTSPSFTGWRG